MDFSFAGELRVCNISKRECVLRGDTVNYLGYEDLRRAIDYDLEQEKRFDYAGLATDGIIVHLARFTEGLWNILAFREGNMWVTAVFLIQYYYCPLKLFETA